VRRQCNGRVRCCGQPRYDFLRQRQSHTDFGGDDQALAGALQPDNRILAAGPVTVGSGKGFGLTRYNPNGSLDFNFGGDGKVTTDFGASEDQATAVALQADDKIVVGGYADAGSNGDFAVARYLPDGSLDATLMPRSRAMEITTDFGSVDDDVYAGALQADGKIVALGFTGVTDAHDFALARYMPNGDLDTSFSFDRKQTTNFGNDDEAFAVALQPDGKNLVGGVAKVGATFDFALARYMTNGDPDNSFNGDGRLSTDFNGGLDGVTGLGLQANGKLLIIKYRRS
jgi:uncharacterized delta-60 repeat protein